MTRRAFVALLLAAVGSVVAHEPLDARAFEAARAATSAPMAGCFEEEQGGPIASHCVDECRDGTGTAYDCKNAVLDPQRSGGGTCCKENYMCAPGSGSPPAPGTGKCTPNSLSTLTAAPGTSLRRAQPVRCDLGFDPDKNCATCTSSRWGPTCKTCPVAKDGSGAVCSGHGGCASYRWHGRLHLRLWLGR